MKFFVGLHQPSDAGKVGLPCMISINRLARRKSDFAVGDWMLDSGAFTAVALRGGYESSPADYARQIRRWAGCGPLLAAAAQDWMCEPFVLAKTGKTVAEHQRLTIERYDDLAACDTAGVHVLPVLQGYMPADYARHVEQYGDRLTPGMWVGVGSVCKRNGSPSDTRAVLRAIKDLRPDLRLHGFGLKLSTLQTDIRGRLHSADSMAWSYAARRQGRSANDWREAVTFAQRVTSIKPPHGELFG